MTSVKSIGVHHLIDEEADLPMTDGIPWCDRPVLDRLERLALAATRAVENCVQHNCASETIAFHRGAEKAYRSAVALVRDDQRDCAATDHTQGQCV